MTMPLQELDPSPNSSGIRDNRLLIHTALEASLAKAKLCLHVRWIQVNGYIKINDGAAQKTCAAVVQAPVKVSINIRRPEHNQLCKRLGGLFIVAISKLSAGLLFVHGHKVPFKEPGRDQDAVDVVPAQDDGSGRPGCDLVQGLAALAQGPVERLDPLGIGFVVKRDSGQKATLLSSLHSIYIGAFRFHADLDI